MNGTLWTIFEIVWIIAGILFILSNLIYISGRRRLP